MPGKNFLSNKSPLATKTNLSKPKTKKTKKIRHKKNFIKSKKKAPPPGTDHNLLMRIHDAANTLVMVEQNGSSLETREAMKIMSVPTDPPKLFERLRKRVEQERDNIVSNAFPSIVNISMVPIDDRERRDDNCNYNKNTVTANFY